MLLKTNDIPLGTKAPDFQDLPCIDGQTYSLADFAEYNALVIIFMCVHCPYVQEIEDQLANIQDEYGDENVQVIGINSNDINQYPEDSLENMQIRATSEGYADITYLRDDTQEVAIAYDAICTPDIYVYNQELRLVYHGRIEEVPAALDNVLNGDDPLENQIPSQGCSIKWEDSE